MNVNDRALPAAPSGRRAIAERSGRDATGVATPTAWALAALSGLAYATGFPPLAWSLAPWLALAPLMIACAALPPAQAAVVGMAWAATTAVAVAWFVPGMLSGYFGLGTVASWLATIIVVGGLHGVFVSGYAAWVAWLARRRAANPILLAGGWLVCEFARAQSGLSSPWALAAYSQVRWTAVIQIADLAGPYGIGMLVAGVNACLAAALTPALRGRRPRLAAATIAAAVLAAGLYGQWRLGQSFDEGAAVHVAVVQAGASPTEKAQRAERLARYVALSAGDAEAAGGLVVWPEYAIEAYLDEPSRARETVLRLADDLHADLILGGPHYEPSPAGTRYHNSAYLVRDQRVVAHYDKHRLVPFAEDGRLAWLHDQPPTAYTAGSGSFILPARGLRVGTLLCVEAMYADLVRRAVDEGAEVLVNLSNDAWFGHPDPARQQLDIATLRAVENRRYLVRAAATGFSAVIDPHGRTLAESAFDANEVLNATVHASRARSPYQRWGDALAWLVIAGVAATSLRALLDPPVRQPKRRFT